MDDHPNAVQPNKEQQMQPSGILKKFFGLKDGQTNMEFIGEMKELKNADPEGYKETVEAEFKED